MAFRTFILLGTLGLLACPQDTVLPECSDAQPCLIDESCLDNVCVIDGSGEAGDNCTLSRQCDGTYACRKGRCEIGCREPYRQSSCDDGSWCEADSDGLAGECRLSQCTPGGVCGDGQECVEVYSMVGQCLTACDYGFGTGAYQDTCNDAEGDRACKPMPFSAKSLCELAGGLESGDAGCDVSSSPCNAGSICVNVVCRTLCQQSQTNPCSAGESCVPLEPANELFYCRAD